MQRVFSVWPVARPVVGEMEMHSVANLCHIADPFSDLFPFKKAPPTNLVSENHGTARSAGLALPARAHLFSRSLSLFASALFSAHTPLSLSLSLRLLSFSPSGAHLSLSLSLCESAQFLSQRVRTPLSLSLCVCSVSAQRAAERSSALIQLNTDIMLLL